MSYKRHFVFNAGLKQVEDLLGRPLTEKEKMCDYVDISDFDGSLESLKFHYSPTAIVRVLQ